MRGKNGMTAIVTVLMLALGSVARAGSVTPGRITALHWGGGTLRISIVNSSDGADASCPGHPEPPFYGARMTVPDDKKLMAAVMLANSMNLLVNAYWDDDCTINGLDVFR